MARPDDIPRELDGRTAAVLAVTDALTGKRFVNESLRDWRLGGRIAGREAGLAMEIAQGTLRHALTIEQVIGKVARFNRDRTAPKARAILYTAAYQVIWMSRIPVFAASDQAVELAHHLLKRAGAGMINAILRRLTGAVVDRNAVWERHDAAQVRVGWDRACTFRSEVLPTPNDGGAAAYMAAATGEHVGRYATLCERLGADQAEAVAWASQAIPVSVVQRNLRDGSREAFADALREACGDKVEVVEDTAFVAPSVGIAGSRPFEAGMMYAQDTTARLAAEAVRAQPGERILDLCSAPGGKTLSMALAMRDEGEVLACDVAADRLGLVVANVQRMNLQNVHTHILDPDDMRPPFDADSCDAAMVDVPCSNTGVIARRPEARLGLTKKKVASLVKVQQALLESGAACVRPGGRLVYSTCSIEPRENGDVVRSFVQRHDNWKLDEERTTLPAWGPKWSDWRDGGYFARLVQSG